MQKTDENLLKQEDVNNNNQATDTEPYRASQTPNEVSLVQGWTLFHHGIESYRSNKTSKKWKYMAVAVLLLVLIALILWGSMTWKELREEINMNKKLAHEFNLRLLRLHFMVDKKNPDVGMKLGAKNLIKSKGNAQPSNSKNVIKSQFAALNLRGWKEQTELSRKGKSFYNWEKSLQTGDIAYSNRFIVIHVPGIYNIYAQMFFFIYEKKYEKPILDFYISKNKKDTLAVTTVPLSSCNKMCTRFMSRLVHLNKGDSLMLASHTHGIPFKMSPTKSVFGAYLVHADK